MDNNTNQPASPVASNAISTPTMPSVPSVAPAMPSVAPTMPSIDMSALNSPLTPPSMSTPSTSGTGDAGVMDALKRIENKLTAIATKVGA